MILYNKKMASNYLDILPVDVLDYIMKWKEFYEYEDFCMNKNFWRIHKIVDKKKRLGLYRDEDEAFDDYCKYNDVLGFEYDEYYGYNGYHEKVKLVLERDREKIKRNMSNDDSSMGTYLAMLAFGV